MSASRQDLEQMGRSLRRVRVADRALDGGGKKVWHQGERGSEVISFVDAGGEVTRQELYLGQAVVVWQQGVSLATGTVRPESSGGDSVVVDPALCGPVALDAAALLGGYAGDDLYLIHFREAIRIGVTRISEAALPTSISRRVTADFPAEPRSATALPRAEILARWPWVVALVVAAAAAALFVARR